MLVCSVCTSSLSLLADTLHTITKNTTDLVDKLTWEPEVVVGEMIKLLMARELPSDGQRLIGSDAKYLMMPYLRMLPAWINVMQYLSPPITPQAMMKHCSTSRALSGLPQQYKSPTK